MPKAKNATSKLPSKAKRPSTASKSKSPAKQAAKPKAVKKLSQQATQATSQKAIKSQKGSQAVAGDRKKPKFKPGTVALREIKKYQRSTDLLLPRAPFQRLVRDAGLLDAKFTAADVDLLFMQTIMRTGIAVEDSGGMGFHEFCDALLAIARRKNGCGGGCGGTTAADATPGSLAAALEKVVLALPGASEELGKSL